jgi:hypothetical protein
MDLSMIMFRYVVMKSRSFDLVNCDLFEQMVSDMFALVGVAVPSLLFVDKSTIKEWVTRDAALARTELRDFFKLHFYRRYWCFSMDERKANNKGVPLVDVIFHGVVLSEGKAEYVSIPLAIVELKNGKSHPAVRGSVLKVFDSFGLAMRFCLNGTGDEADKYN